MDIAALTIDVEWQHDAACSKPRVDPEWFFPRGEEAGSARGRSASDAQSSRSVCNTPSRLGRNTGSSGGSAPESGDDCSNLGANGRRRKPAPLFFWIGEEREVAFFVDQDAIHSRLGCRSGGFPSEPELRSVHMKPDPITDLSTSEHKLELAKELLDDIELTRLTGEQIILKAFRLARAVDDIETLEWLRYEMFGYRNEAKALKYMGYTGRWTDPENKKGMWGSLSEIEQNLEARRVQLEGTRVPNLQSDAIVPAIDRIQNAMTHLGTIIATLGTIRSKVLALLHGRVSRTYYELAFSERQEEMFELTKARIDSLLGPVSGDALLRIESIYKRLSEGDTEAVSQALNTCRRLVNSFADAVYSAQATPALVNGQTIQRTEAHHQNRINLFIADHCSSSSRRKRLKRTLSDLYERISAGVHADVSSEEARFLFLSTYLLLGEILSLDENRVEDSEVIPPEVSGHQNPSV